MQPFSRETIIDRRQPGVRWSAVFAGAVAAVSTWMLLELLGLGLALLVLDGDDVAGIRSFAIGTTVWSMLAPLFALFVGGYLAGRLSAHYDRLVAGLHGALVWALTTVFGVVAIAGAVSMLDPTGRPTTAPPAVYSSRADLERTLEPVNARLEARKKPTLSVDDLVVASRAAILPSGAFDRVAFANKLDIETKLTRAEAEDVVRDLGDRAQDVAADAYRLGEHRRHVIDIAKRAGNGLFGAGIALLLGLGVAIGGALLVNRRLVRRRPDTETGLDESAAMPHSTAPYPIQTPVD
jgi:hypothetical protein